MGWPNWAADPLAGRQKHRDLRADINNQPAATRLLYKPENRTADSTAIARRFRILPSLSPWSREPISTDNARNMEFPANRSILC
jgi:hypothetical protein